MRRRWGAGSRCWRRPWGRACSSGRRGGSFPLRRREGVVRVTTTEAFAVNTLLPRFAPFRERHPGIEVRFLTDYGALDLRRREADVAVRLTRPSEASLVARKVGDIAISLYASEGYVARRGLADPATGF